MQTTTQNLIERSAHKVDLEIKIFRQMDLFFGEGIESPTLLKEELDSYYR